MAPAVQSGGGGECRGPLLSEATSSFVLRSVDWKQVTRSSSHSGRPLTGCRYQAAVAMGVFGEGLAAPGTTGKILSSAPRGSTCPRLQFTGGKVCMYTHVCMYTYMYTYAYTHSHVLCTSVCTRVYNIHMYDGGACRYLGTCVGYVSVCI